jgi:hypothetical protein
MFHIVTTLGLFFSSFKSTCFADFKYILLDKGGKIIDIDGWSDVALYGVRLAQVSECKPESQLARRWRRRAVRVCSRSIFSHFLFCLII